jgi:gamma-glutamylcyclotransferase (GGCT)/AIG2-like uncharacterized protein YtfP
LLYLAYGMNTNNGAMSNTSVRLGAATLIDYQWEMLQFANVFASSGHSTVGILWDIDQTALQDLDCREGYPAFYDRVITQVRHNGEQKSAWVYYMTLESRTNLIGSLPSQHYYDSVVQGYAQQGLLIPQY